MKNERSIPIILQKEEALSRRLPRNHHKLPKLLESIEMRKAGLRGELNVDYHLTFLPKNKYIIIKGIQLTDKYSFQIDTLLLSKHLFFLLEIKNYSGTLTYDKNSKQLIQNYNNTEKGYPNPIQQAQRQLYQLRDWLEHHKFPPIPIEYLISISQAKTILKSNDPAIFKKIMHADHIVNRIKEIEPDYPSLVLDEKTLRKISKTLLKENTSSSPSILEKWNIIKTEVLPGVICPQCHKLPMLRVSSAWYCQFCKSTSKDAHIQAIQDYFWLLGDSISNKQCRDFLLLSSRRTAQNILVSMKLTSFGAKKGVYYTEP